MLAKKFMLKPFMVVVRVIFVLKLLKKLDTYHLSDGRNKSEYAQCYELWINLDEVSNKVLHDQLTKEIRNIFSTFSNSWANQLTINDMEAILDIVRKAEIRNK